jgi:hypothetical protein
VLDNPQQNQGMGSVFGSVSYVMDGLGSYYRASNQEILNAYLNPNVDGNQYKAMISAQNQQMFRPGGPEEKPVVLPEFLEQAIMRGYEYEEIRHNAFKGDRLCGRG